MKAIDKFFVKEFKSEEPKEAYLKACKWIAKHITSKVEVEDVLVKIIKVQDADFPTYKVELYAELHDGEYKSSFCGFCQQFHKSFYINHNYNCDKCNMMSYREGMERKLRIKSKYKKERLEYSIKKDE